MLRELAVRREELPGGSVPTIYFGGGTPSLLTSTELEGLFAEIRRAGYWRGELETEITFEANPDDLTADVIRMLADSPVNRLSIGIQSFNEEDLRFMNRAHDARQALTAVEKVREVGFDNLSIDLIYGAQTTSDLTWQQNLEFATELEVDHIAAYALTVEPKTALGHRVATGAVPDTSDERFATHFGMLIDHLTATGYEQYEISNFARPGHRSRHNSGYWTGQPYLGIGPGAHSFDGKNRRRWNVSNNNRYAKVWPEVGDYSAYLDVGPLLFEEENLSLKDRYNEYVMTGLRRIEGITPGEISRKFGADLAQYFESEMAAHLANGNLRPLTAENIYRLSRRGLEVADGVAADAFY
ncbi:oxygen-independent coproporphyrinogen-3 oxidase [Lewinella aquimaris]|uniref:Heme chaperone HemW n=2 Tax=Neolewinella aquimaris TaxID=1835722 RepID=A0A840E515_9BACT|nr:oxygen-independent coproporphyrinogen-3 oxidase [Neolewinella aquimaris]